MRFYTFQRRAREACIGTILNGPSSEVEVLAAWWLKSTFNKTRRRIANKLQNPRLIQIHFHALRHWKATMEYRNTKDLLHTMAFLGHKKSDTTLMYIQLDQKLFKQSDDSFTTKIAHNVDEAAALVEVGFEYVTGEYDDGGKLFRKPK